MILQENETVSPPRRCSGRLRKFCLIMIGKQANWKHVFDEDVANVRNLRKNFEDALAEFRVLQSKENKETLNKTRSALEKELRYFLYDTE